MTKETRRGFLRKAAKVVGGAVGAAVVGDGLASQLLGRSWSSLDPYQSPAIRPAMCRPRIGPSVFPDRFQWGSSIAAYQVESGLHGTDWTEFLKTHGSGDDPDLGPDFIRPNTEGAPGGHFRQYLDEARRMGLNAFRFSLDWSRIQPTRARRYDKSAIAMYRALFDACDERGMLGVVTLFHYVAPLWAHNPSKPEESLGGWAGVLGNPPEQAPIIDAFIDFVTDMMHELGGRMGMVIPFNEPSGNALASYVAGVFPGPGALRFDGARRAQEAMAHAHARTYDVIKKARPKLPVGVVQGLRAWAPLSGSPGDRDAAAKMAYASNWIFTDAVSAGTADWNLDGVAEDEANPALKGRLDFVGLNYFTRTRLLAILPPFAGTQGVRGLPDEVIPGFRPERDSQMRWSVYPRGLFDVSLEAWARYGLPLYVTENGFAEGEPDLRRPGYIRDHVAELERARMSGADLRGYFYWSLVDNFEWNKGFRPHFGLLASEPGKAGEYRWTNGARELQRIVQNDGVLRSLGQPLTNPPH